MSTPPNPISLSTALEKALDWPEVYRELPWFSLPEGYSFKPLFPFCGACVRFLVSKDTDPDNHVSVYLDTKQQLGFYMSTDEGAELYGVPYWEAYPIGDDVKRFPMSEGPQLIAAIVSHLLKGDN